LGCCNDVPAGRKISPTRCEKEPCLVPNEGLVF
jgi:hypothetical protein